MRRTALLSGLLCGALLLPLPPTRAQSQAVQDQADAAGALLAFDIPAQPIDTALSAFADAAHVNIAFRTGALGNVRSAPLRGRYTPQAALRLLLEGTGLAAAFTGPRSAIIYGTGAGAAQEAQARAAVRRTSLPTMELDLAEVRAPLIIGSNARPDGVDYARRAQERIRAILAADSAYKGKTFKVRIAVTTDSAGTISNVVVDDGRGGTDRNVRLASLLVGRPLGGPPPRGLAQPMWFSISADLLPPIAERAPS